MKNLNKFFFISILFTSLLIQCKLDVPRIIKVNVLVAGLYSTKPINFTEKIVRDMCPPIEITDPTFLIEFKNELEKSKQVFSFNKKFSLDAICDIYFMNGDSVSLYISKSYMIYGDRVFKRNENLVNSIEDKLKQLKEN